MAREPWQHYRTTRATLRSVIPRREYGPFPTPVGEVESPGFSTHGGTKQSDTALARLVGLTANVAHNGSIELATQ